MVSYKGFLKRVGKVVKYRDLVELSRLFGVPLSYKMKQELIGNLAKSKADYSEIWAFKKRLRKSLEPQNSDFVGRFLHSEVLSGLAIVPMRFLNI